MKRDSVVKILKITNTVPSLSTRRTLFFDLSFAHIFIYLTRSAREFPFKEFGIFIVKRRIFEKFGIKSRIDMTMISFDCVKIDSIR